MLWVLHGLLSHVLEERRVVQIEHGITMGWREHEGHTKENVPNFKSFPNETTGFKVL